MKFYFHFWSLVYNLTKLDYAWQRRNWADFAMEAAEERE